MPGLKSGWHVKPRAMILIIGALGLIFLYLYNPQDISYFPRCPFLVLTGYKCPGCGTLRAIHALLHFDFVYALQLNPFLIISIPLLAAMLISRKVAYNVTLGVVIVVVTIVYWILRNIPSITEACHVL